MVLISKWLSISCLIVKQEPKDVTSPEIEQAYDTLLSKVRSPENLTQLLETDRTEEFNDLSEEAASAILSTNEQLLNLIKESSIKRKESLSDRTVALLDEVCTEKNIGIVRALEIPEELHKTEGISQEFASPCKQSKLVNQESFYFNVQGNFNRQLISINENWFLCRIRVRNAKIHFFLS